MLEKQLAHQTTNMIQCPSYMAIFSPFGKCNIVYKTMLWLGNEIDEMKPFCTRSIDENYIHKPGN